MTKKILFLTPYPEDTAGSQRFRFEQYLSLLSDSEFEYDCQSFLDKDTWHVIYKEGYQFKKVGGILKGFLRRFWKLKSIRSYHFVFVHREATPMGFPIIEWIIAKIWKKKIIYDFDDAIWLSNTSVENSLIAKLKFPKKVNLIISWSYKVSAGNQYLIDHASNFNKLLVHNPTTIETENRHIPVPKKNQPIIIGWTGTHSTLKYIEALREPLEQLAQSTQFEFIIIADKSPDKAFPNQRYVTWNKETEIDDLNQIDIGLMPLKDDQWAMGKCGFKALQFMALEIAVLVSPVGVNQSMVQNGLQGFHCLSTDDWIEKLKLLMGDATLRNKMGKAGRRKVINEYSVESNKENFLSLFI